MLTQTCPPLDFIALFTVDLNESLVCVNRRQKEKGTSSFCTCRSQPAVPHVLGSGECDEIEGKVTIYYDYTE